MKQKRFMGFDTHRRYPPDYEPTPAEVQEMMGEMERTLRESRGRRAIGGLAMLFGVIALVSLVIWAGWSLIRGPFGLPDLGPDGATGVTLLGLLLRESL